MRRVLYTFIIAVLVVLGLIVTIQAGDEKAECEQSGGVFVREAAGGWACVDRLP